MAASYEEPGSSSLVMHYIALVVVTAQQLGMSLMQAVVYIYLPD